MSIFKIKEKAAYSQKVDEILSKGRIIEGEKESLDILQKYLKLEDSVANKIFDDKRKGFYFNYINKILANKSYSPEEEKELQEISNSLKVYFTLDDPTKLLLNKYRSFWEKNNKTNIGGVEVGFNPKSLYINIFDDPGKVRTVDEASKIAASLILDIQDETRKIIADTINNAIKNGYTHKSLTQDLINKTGVDKNTA